MAIRYDDFVKRPNEELEYTPENIEELIKCRDDILYFTVNYVKIVTLDYGEKLFEPYEYQIEALDLLKKHRYFIGLWSRQSGKALSLDTLIPKHNGEWCTMGDIKVGDVILGKDGNSTKVVFTTEVMYDHDCYEIEFDNQEKIIADSDHLWQVDTTKIRACKLFAEKNNSKTKAKSIVVDTEYLYNNQKDSRGYNNFSIDIAEPIKNPYKEFIVDPYCLGFWLSDGIVNLGEISQKPGKDQEFIKNEFEKAGYETTKLSNKYKFGTKKFAPDLRKIGVLNNKHIPREYFGGSIDQRLSLLQGLLDGDGCILSNGQVTYDNINKDLASGVHELFCGLGIKSKFITLKRKTTIGNIVYRVDALPTINVFRMDRKRILFKERTPKTQISRRNRIYIKEIKKVKSVPVKCIQVDNKDNLFLCGKTMIPTHNSTVFADYALWYAIFNEDKNIGIVSNKETSAKRILDNIKRMYEGLPPWLKPGVTEYAKTSITFDNGSKIIISATTADAFRGWPMNMLLMDEYAFVPKQNAEEFWASNYPTISSSNTSRIIIISTPNGMFSLFHRLWAGAQADAENKNSFVAQKVSWERVPGRDKEWAKEQIKNLGIQAFNQEFAVAFLGSVNTVISPEVLRTLLNSYKDPEYFDLKDRLRIWEKPVNGAMYALGVDPSKGTGEHFSTIQIFKINSTLPINMEQVATFEDNLTDVYEFSQIIHRLSIYYNNAYIMCENNGEGSSVISQLQWQWENENLVNTGSKIVNLGIRSSKNTKSKAVLLMKKLIEDGSVELKDENTIKQLASFIEEDGKFFGKDKDDDLVDAVFWACYIFEMGILSDDWNFKGKKEKDDVWGVLSDIDDNIDDWSWLDDSKVFD